MYLWVLLIGFTHCLCWANPIQSKFGSVSGIQPIKEQVSSNPPAFIEVETVKKSTAFESNIVKTVVPPPQLAAIAHTKQEQPPSEIPQSIKSIASSKQPAKSTVLTQSSKQLQRKQPTHYRQARQVRSQEYGQQLPLSYSELSNHPLSSHPLLLHSHEHPDMVGVLPVIRDVQPVIPWSYPFGSLPYKFNHYSTKTGEIRRGPLSPVHLSQETLDVGLKESPQESSALPTENKPTAVSAPVNKLVGQLSNSELSTPVESASSLAANAETLAATSSSIANQSGSSNPSSNASSFVSDSISNKDSLSVDPNKQSGVLSSSASNSGDSFFDSSIEPETVRPGAVKGVVREYPSRLAGLNGFKTGFGQNNKGFNVPRDFYPSFNSYASDFESLLPLADSSAFSSLSAPKYPFLYNNQPSQPDSASIELTDQSKAAITNRMSGHSSKISPAFILKSNPNPSVSAPSEDNSPDEQPVSVDVLDDSKDSSADDQALSYSPTGPIRRRVTNNYDRSQVKPIVIPIKINTRNHYGAPTYIHPSASATANIHSSSSSESSSSYPPNQIFGQTWAPPSVFTSPPVLSNPLLLQSIQANRIYSQLLSNLLPILAPMNSFPMPSPMTGSYPSPSFPGFRGPLSAEEAHATPIISPMSPLSKISLSSKPWKSFQGPILNKFPSDLIPVGTSSLTADKLSSPSKETSEKLIETPVQSSTLHYAQDSASPSSTSAAYRYSPYATTGSSSTSGSAFAYNPYSAYGGNAYTSPYNSYSAYGSNYGSSYPVRPIMVSDPGSGYLTATPNGAFVTIRFPNMAGINSLLSSPQSSSAYNAYRPTQNRPYAGSPYAFGFPNLYSADPNFMYTDSPVAQSDERPLFDSAIKSSSSSYRLSKAADLTNETKEISNLNNNSSVLLKQESEIKGEAIKSDSNVKDQSPA